jgi:hypothetical protein
MFGFPSYKVVTVFDLIMMFGFLDAVASEFIYSEWERKAMYMAVYISVPRNMGPGANLLHSAVRISS